MPRWQMPFDAIHTSNSSHLNQMPMRVRNETCFQRTDLEMYLYRCDGVMATCMMV